MGNLIGGFGGYLKGYKVGRLGRRRLTFTTGCDIIYHPGIPQKDFPTFLPACWREGEGPESGS